MKKTILLLLFLTSILPIYAWKPIFAGHRGGYTGVSNTVECYKNGVEIYGFQGLECDIRVTLDKKYVILHDETTNSLGGSLTVATSTLEQLKAETLKETRGGVTYTGKICTVEEYLDVCKDKGAFPLMEMKWTTGINNNDMSNFPGLYELIKSKGLEDKVVFLTSMKNSLEYVRKNYPNVKCQFLTNQNWASSFDWCVKWGINPTIQIGTFDARTVKKFHNAGLQVALWTINDKTNYLKYGNMGVYMMTGDYIKGSEMPDLADVDWDAIPDYVDPVEITTETLWKYSEKENTLPANFPSKTAATYKNGQQAGIYKGTFYVNDQSTSKLLVFDKSGEVSTSLAGTNSLGVTCDDAGNLIQRNDGITSTPSSFIITKNGENIGTEVKFSLLNNGQTNFIFASGDIFSKEGGYVYQYPKGAKAIDIIKIADGKYVDITSKTGLTTDATTAGIVIPFNNDTTQFLYQVRNLGFYQFDETDNGDFFTGTASATAPARNSSLGGAYLLLNGHEILIHPSGSNYNGGLSIRDMTADATVLATFGELGTKSYDANASTGSFLNLEKIDDDNYYLYNYTMGAGYAAYKISLKDTGVEGNIISKANDIKIYPSLTNGPLNISAENSFNTVSVYNVAGGLVYSERIGAESAYIDLSNLASGMYIVKVDGYNSKAIIKK